jgi:hypothetical protein
VREESVVVFTTCLVSGELAVSAESTEVAFVDPAVLGAWAMHEPVRLRIRHVLEHRDRPYLSRSGPLAAARSGQQVAGRPVVACSA